MLALKVNRVVPTDRLIDGLWGQHPQPNAVGTEVSNAAQLRIATAWRAASVAAPL